MPCKFILPIHGLFQIIGPTYSGKTSSLPPLFKAMSEEERKRFHKVAVVGESLMSPDNLEVFREALIQYFPDAELMYFKHKTFGPSQKNELLKALEVSNLRNPSMPSEVMVSSFLDGKHFISLPLGHYDEFKIDWVNGDENHLCSGSDPIPSLVIIDDCVLERENQYRKLNRMNSSYTDIQSFFRSDLHHHKITCIFIRTSSLGPQTTLLWDQSRSIGIPTIVENKFYTHLNANPLKKKTTYVLNAIQYNYLKTADIKLFIWMPFKIEKSEGLLPDLSPGDEDQDYRMIHSVYSIVPSMILMTNGTIDDGKNTYKPPCYQIVFREMSNLRSQLGVESYMKKQKPVLKRLSNTKQTIVKKNAKTTTPTGKISL
jgi:hypothetical protein